MLSLRFCVCTALLEERRTVAALKGKKIEVEDLDLSDIKKQEDAENDNYAPPTTTAVRGTGRGRGRGSGRGRGRGAALKTDVVESTLGDTTIRVKKETGIQRAQEELDDDEVEPQVPLLHLHDGYGWNDEKQDMDNEEPLVRRHARTIRQSDTAADSSTSTAHSAVHLDALAGGALDLISRVSKAANRRHTASRSSSPATTVKMEPSELSDSALLLRKHVLEAGPRVAARSATSSGHKRHRTDSSDGPTTTDVISSRSRTRMPVYSM